MKKILAALATIVIAHAASAQQHKTDSRPAIMDSLFSALFAEGVFSGNVLVAEKGKVIYRTSLGTAEEPGLRKLNDQSIFELASCSKQFTAAAIVLLQQQGKLSYDDLLSKWIPELSAYKGITIRHLLHHTAGLPDYMGLMDTVWDHHKMATNKDVIKALQQYHPAADFAPGEKYEYSNTGYALLSSVIEAVSGKSYAAFLEQQVFKPLDMKHSFVYTRRYAPRKVDNYAYGYVYSDSLRRNVLPDSAGADMVIWLDGITGDGTVNSTVDDLLKWDRALYTDRLFTAVSRKLMATPGRLKDGSETKYGLGWMVKTDSLMGQIMQHSGGWPGYVTYIERHTDKDKTIIVLQNNARVKLPVKELRNILYGIPLLPAVKHIAIDLTPEQLSVFTGTYELSPEFSVTISLDEGQLMVQATGQQKFAAFPESETVLFLKVVDAQMEFVKNSDGKIERMILHQGGNHSNAKKVM